MVPGGRWLSPGSCSTPSAASSSAAPRLRRAFSNPEPYPAREGLNLRREGRNLRIAAVGRSLPPHYYDQETLLAALRRRWSDRYFNLDRLERLHKNVLV